MAAGAGPPTADIIQAVGRTNDFLESFLTVKARAEKRATENEDRQRPGRIVVKFGTNLLTGGRDTLDERVAASLVDQVAEIRGMGCEVLIVTSGAVALGREAIAQRGQVGRFNRWTLAYRQALAAIGQAKLMHMYERLFSAHGDTVAQAMVTRGDLQNRLGYLNFRNTLETLLEIGAIPVINENDVVGVDELEGGSYGDNDRLSAMVANSIDADLLVLLGEMDGLFTADPDIDPEARFIPEVREIDDHVVQIAGDSRDGRGRGGMASKVEAARLATASGTDVVIASGRTENVLPRLYDGEKMGTRFTSNASHIESRKRWVLTGVTEHRGGVLVDDGAASAVRNGGTSLLPAGIADVEGVFGRGEIIAIKDADGEVVAWGVANYSSDDLGIIKGRKSAEVRGLLGREYGPEVVHRDNMAVV